MLFSEPKIPQCNDAQAVAELMLSFSALQRAENSSICRCRSRSRVDGAFQCSSASRKFLNQKRILLFHLEYAFQCSSASRKFLNRICGRSESEAKDVFQCSSASRKFLNQSAQRRRISQTTSFSALQRAENSSIGSMTLRRCSPASVSVLFSEPKIPQCECRFRHCRHSSRFSALQRAENSSILEVDLPGTPGAGFQCSSASRKFLNRHTSSYSVTTTKFQCSSASRKFLNPDPRTCVHPYSRLRRSRFVVPEPSWCVAMTPVY